MRKSESPRQRELSADEWTARYNMTLRDLGRPHRKRNDEPGHDPLPASTGEVLPSPDPPVDEGGSGPAVPAPRLEEVASLEISASLHRPPNRCLEREDKPRSAD